jgi:hypothetical protein
MITSRRSFLAGLGAVLVTAPPIVRAGSLMPVKAMPPEVDLQALLNARMNECYAIMRKNMEHNLYGDLTEITRLHMRPLLGAQSYAYRVLEATTPLK